MISESLEPRLNLLTQEYVLVQAWKKTASYIRAHNWYADTLELDRAAVNLPEFISEVAKRFSNTEQWENDFLRLVPAPKSQRWHVDESGNWKPIKRDEAAKQIRPLAHVTLRDQVAATALVLCLADRVETFQGDPRTKIDTIAARKKNLSYGNRLFCDADDSGALRHRWGASKLYRGFFQDYRAFLKRPEVVAEEHDDGRIVVVHSDLRQFYDRVAPELLAEKIEALRIPGDDAGFFDLARRILCWKWDLRDESEVTKYAAKAGLNGFSRIALPQGLVASGFFSNIVMLDFDNDLRDSVGREEDFIEGAVLLDACRYVDDIRLVLSCRSKMDPDVIKGKVVERLQGILHETATGMKLSEVKTKIAYFHGDERPLLRQSRKMERIQHAVSGGFDAIGGTEILDAIQGLVRAQSRFSKERIEGHGWSFAPVADVRDETVARFAAGRFRTTYRSLRPLLESQKAGNTEDSNVEDDSIVFGIQQVDERKTQVELDDDARAFAFGLIENWIEDPSNVRLLRVGLDIWPAKDILEKVLGLLRPYTSKGGRSAARSIALYCLAEIFRAGATETGFVADEESLPDSVDVQEYRRALMEEAQRLSEQNANSLPWYLKQQIFLFMAANNPLGTPIIHRGKSPETKRYRELIRYLRAETTGLLDWDYAIFAILARRSFNRANNPIQLAGTGLTPNRLKQIATRDPSFAHELLNAYPETIPALASRIRQSQSLTDISNLSGKITLADVVRAFPKAERGNLANELTILTFSEKFLSCWDLETTPEFLTPASVLVEIKSGPHGLEITDIEFKDSKVVPTYSLYSVPDWCETDARWRIQLGYLLRFILTGQHDFTKSVKPDSWKEGSAIYRVPESHWYQRIYGLHSGYTAFGADWLPITDWTEQLLYALLKWPGCRYSGFSKSYNLGLDEAKVLVNERIKKLQSLWGAMSEVLMLPLTPKWPQRLPEKTRPLRACVVQTIIPDSNEIQKATDLTLSEQPLRKRHRQHISAALAAITKMLHLRETYKKIDGRLDLVIFPELSVHPKDIETHLVPFARANRTIILVGLTYEELFSGKPLVNSALWIIPVWSEHKGLEILCRRQGKMNLAPSEKRKNYPVQKIKGFRPCQWLVGYPWDATEKNDPLWLTGSICYDATDIRLACDLRDKSDIFAISAMNKDVKTFDQMAIALQYHMFQMVIVANNGEFGGSNAYAPYSDAFDRQIFHLHGKQTLMAFVEIAEIEEFQKRKMHASELPTEKSGSTKTWKCPPAGICLADVCLHNDSVKS